MGLAGLVVSPARIMAIAVAYPSMSAPSAISWVWTASVAQQYIYACEASMASMNSTAYAGSWASQRSVAYQSSLSSWSLRY